MYARCHNFYFSTTLTDYQRGDIRILIPANDMKSSEIGTWGVIANGETVVADSLRVGLNVAETMKTPYTAQELSLQILIGIGLYVSIMLVVNVC